MIPRPIRRAPKPSEKGYILLAVICLLALFILSLSIALPSISRQIERDREIETMHRGKQYVRAIKLYYKKFGNYPSNVDALVNTNQMRFLRKKYIDPITGKNDWKPIHYGQNKLPTAYGFFGQPIASSMGSMGGAGCGGSGLNSSSLGSSSFGSSSMGSSGFGSSASQGSSSPTGGTGCPPDASSTAAASGGSGTTGASGISTDASGGNTGGTGGTDSSSSSDSSSSATSTGLSGQTFGGGGIIGFTPGSPKKSILLYKKKNHFNQWEFVYDPAQDQVMQMGGGATGLTPSSSMPGSSGIGSTGGFGNSGGFGSSGFGNSGSSSLGSSSGGNASGSSTSQPQ